MKVLALVALAAVFLSAFWLVQATRALPLTELRRRARSDQDKNAHAVYKLAAYGASADLVLWLIVSLSAAGLVLVVAASAWWLGILLIVLIGWLIMYGGVSTDGWGWKISAWLSPPAGRLVSLAQPLLNKPASWLHKRRPKRHTRIFEKDDLLETFDFQARQADNRLSQSEINLAKGALTFGDKTVGSVMTPRQEVKLAAAGDPIGPHLMDELHASGFNRLPVAKDTSGSDTPEIVGTLYLKDLTSHQGKGRVRDVMKPAVHFVNETQNLRQALGVFLNTQSHLLIVVNNFEEFAGILSIEDVMEQILGQPITDDFEQYDELRAVAGLDAEASQTEQSESEVIE
jgi:CBS domain containing-hemolysin-like protein